MNQINTPVDKDMHLYVTFALRAISAVIMRILGKDSGRDQRDGASDVNPPTSSSPHDDEDGTVARRK